MREQKIYKHPYTGEELLESIDEQLKVMRRFI